MSYKAKKIALLIAVVCCTGWLHTQIPATTRADLGRDFVPTPEAASAVALGFDALLSDYYWLQAVQVVGGDSAVDESRAGHIGKLVDVVTTLNPNVGHPYRFAAVWLTHNEEQVRFANELLERSFESHPDEWRNHFYLGFNQFFYLGEYDRAAESLERAMALPGAPGYLPRLVARLKSHTADIEVAEVFLRQILETATDEAQIAKTQAALDEIEIEHKARHLDRAREAYRSLAGRDLERIEDLLVGRFRVLKRLPSPEPDAIPESLSRGSVWEIDPDSGRIVSSYLGSRYEIHFSGTDEQRFRAWRGDGATDETALKAEVSEMPTGAAKGGEGG